MNRREFTKSLAVAAVAPALPMPVLAKAGPAPTNIQIMWAEAIARAQNNGGAEFLAKALKVSPGVGESLSQHLLNKGITKVASSQGAIVATRPTFPVNFNFSNAGSVTTQVRNVVDKIKDHLPEDEPAEKVEDEIEVTVSEGSET